MCCSGITTPCPQVSGHRGDVDLGSETQASWNTVLVGVPEGPSPWWLRASTRVRGSTGARGPPPPDPSGAASSSDRVSAPAPDQPCTPAPQERPPDQPLHALSPPGAPTCQPLLVHHHTGLACSSVHTEIFGTALFLLSNLPIFT